MRTKRESYRYRCADGTVVVESEKYPTLFHRPEVPAVSATLAFWSANYGGPLERVTDEQEDDR